MRKLILLLLGMLITAGCASQATFGDAMTDGEPTPIPTPILPSKPVYEVGRGEIVSERTFYGRVAPAVTNEFGFQIDGRVSEVYVSAGDDVSEGDLLAVLNTAALQEQLLIAEEQLAIAQSILESANNQAEFGQQRAQLQLDLAQLYLDHAVAQSSEPPTLDDTFLVNVRTVERDLAQLAVDEFDNGVDPELLFDVSQAQNQVDDINDLIGQSELRAPMDGRLTAFSIEPGDPVIAFEAVGVVSELSGLEVVDSGSSFNISELVEGMDVTMQPTIGAGAVYEGSIVALPQPYGSGVDGSVHIQFSEPVGLDQLTIGDRMTITVVIDTREDVIWLPLSAIRQFNGRDFVVVQNENLQQRVDVKLGLRGEDRVEILEGVEEGQMVIGP